MPKLASRLPDSTDIEIGKRIRAHRNMKELSQADLAKALGVSFQQIQKYEKGVNRISAGRIDTICKCLGINRDDLLGTTAHEPSNDADAIMDFLGKPQGAQLARLASRLSTAQCFAMNGFINLMLSGRTPVRS